jgi:hypothetical protein
VPDPTYHPYTAWEDWQAGMWQTPTSPDRDMQRAAHVLASPGLFRDAARMMLREWPNAAEHNLTTNLASNRYSWVGQATCCHLANVPEVATRAAWWTLTPAEQVAANAVAAEVIAEWEADREESERPGLFLIEFPAHTAGEAQRSA